MNARIKNFLIIGAALYLPSTRALNCIPSNSQTWITIWVHGTQPNIDLIPNTSLRAIVEKYAQTYFYNKTGLHSITEQSKQNHHYQLAQILNQSDPALFPLNHPNQRA